jgi:prefoldin beta subunit
MRKLQKRNSENRGQNKMSLLRAQDFQQKQARNCAQSDGAIVMDEDAVAEFQTYQQQLQTVVIQKESFKLQSLEVAKAIEELQKTNQKTAYKITGSIMISKPVEELKKDLEEAKESIELKIKSLEKSEEKINNKLKELQSKLQEGMK